MRILLFCIVSVIIFAIGECVQCYNCVEIPEGEFPGMRKCMKSFSKNDNNPTCSEHGYCMKGVGYMNGHTVVMRQCMRLMEIPEVNFTQSAAPKDPIRMQLGSVIVTAHLCDTDFCNAASVPSASMLFAIVPLMTLFFISA